MRFVCKSVLAIVLALAGTGMGRAADYGLPANIQDGNILHCFNWSMNQVKEELPNIAAAGFGSVQLSPLQRADIRSGESWSALYRPYDMAFKSSSFMGGEAELRALCSEAEKYGIKVIVDVVANHVDKTSGYHDTWWDSNNRVRWEGGINYGNRYSITHGQLGDYGDINSELSEVAARGKAYVQKLKEMGVKGCRWDAAKHIGLPSENCGFWREVTSVPGMYHYGEILDTPGPDASIIKEYANYMSVTDNRYCNGAARDNGGLPTGYGGEWAVNQGLNGNKLVYWGESHDTYSNDEWSQNVDQSVIDRAYASFACRNGATALYLARPNAKGYGNIRVGKGSTAFKNKHIAEVNKFRNVMTGREDYCEAGNGTFTVTRKGGGAVIVMRGSGNVNVKNGGGYCPVGTYKDRVSGGTFTVTASNISGNVGSSGIAVIYNDGTTPTPNPDPDPTPDPDPDPNPGADLPEINGVYLQNSANWSTPYVWAWNGETNCTLSGNWPGDQMTKYGDYWKWEVPAGKTTPANIIFNPGGDEGKTGDLTYVKSGIYDCSGKQIGVAKPGGDDPTPGTDFVIYYDNSATSWSNVNIHHWNNPNTSWPGASMTKVEGNIWKYTFPSDPSGLDGFLFNDGSGNGGTAQTADYTGIPQRNHLYKGAGGDKGAVSDMGVYSAEPTPDKPVVTANPASGTRFTESVKVTLTVSPAATIYYTTNGSAPTTSSSRYSSALTFTETTTLKTLAVTSAGGKNEQTFTYTKQSEVVIPEGNSLNTNYYKVNPDGRVGTNRTVNMKFTKLNNDNRMCVADNALSNWTDADLICQGVARDIASSIKGKHEYPCVDSYAIYAAYDSQNLYLGVQYVYSTWDLYGDGILTNGAAKPYNMDGRLMIAFDLDPTVGFAGVLANGNTIWDEGGQFNTFDNGTDCILLCSTKSTVGTPGLFFPTPDNKASYDAAYCKGIDAPFYGCQDGLLPSITHIWAPAEFEYDPEMLKSNEGFTDIKGKAPDNQHTFYEWKLPLSKLGITESYIKNEGIGVMVIDTYGQGATGCTPYDPTVFDNAATAYSKDESSSAEKEDKDIFTFAHARIGKIRTSAVESVAAEVVEEDATPVYYNLQGVQVAEPTHGIYIVRRGSKVQKVVIR